MFRVPRHRQWRASETINTRGGTEKRNEVEYNNFKKPVKGHRIIQFGLLSLSHSPTFIIAIQTKSRFQKATDMSKFKNLFYQSILNI